MERIRRFEWDELHALGSSKLVQLTVVLPVIGYLILFSDSLRQHLALYVDMGTEPILWRLYLLYFGFCFLSVGALIFAWQCPDEIKWHRAGFVFVERESRVYMVSGDRTGHLQRALIGLRLGLISATGTLRAWSPERLQELRSDARVVAMEQTVGRLPLESLMVEYFVALKQSKRNWRVAARLSYDLGFFLLAIPTVAVFVSVVRSSVELVRQTLG